MILLMSREMCSVFFRDRNSLVSDNDYLQDIQSNITQILQLYLDENSLLGHFLTVLVQCFQLVF